MNKILIATLIFFTTLVLSCEKERPDPGATAAVNMADEWWVHETLNGVAVTTGNPKHIYTYNTSENDNTMWVDDRSGLPVGKRLKAKVIADYSALTFSATAADNLAQATKKVTITNGKVLKGVGHSRTNEKTDSIFFNVEYSDDPGKIYTVTGHARTFFIDDDY